LLDIAPSWGYSKIRESPWVNRRPKVGDLVKWGDVGPLYIVLEVRDGHFNTRIGPAGHLGELWVRSENLKILSEEKSDEERE
jgi:hypothetical protein